MKSAIVIIFILLQAVLCAQTNNLQKVKLQLQWKYQFQFAGFIMAKELGYYKEAGLDVDIIEYNNTNSIQDLEENKIDYAINNSLLAYHDKRLNKVTLLATYFQRSPLVIITQPEIKSVLGLKGKKVMISENNRYNSSLSIMLDYFNINSQNTNFINPSFNIDDFIDKKVDAVTGFRSNELFLLNKKNIPYNVIDPVEYGFSTNAINLFASHEKMKNNPQQIKNFLYASKKGWKYALENIDETAKIIHEKYQPNKSVEHLAYEGRVTKQLMLLDLYDIGDINKDFVLKTYERLLKSGKLDQNQTSDKIMFDEDAGKDSKKPTIDLTQEEKEWIEKNKTVSFTGDPNWLPYEAFDKEGNYIGIVSEYLSLIEQLSGLRFKPLPVSSWSESLQRAMSGDVKVISGDTADKTLKQKFNPIDTYSNNQVVIIMDIKNNYVEDLNSISDKKIAIIKDYGYTADIFNTYPHINFVEVQNIQEGLEGVSGGKYDAMLATSALASYTITDMALHNLKIVGKTPIVMKLTLFVSKDEPLLFNIINKSINSISQEEKHNILNKWMKQKYVERIDYTLIIYITLISMLIIFFILFWSFKMKQEIKKRSALLEAIKLERDRNELYLDTAEVLMLALDKEARVTMLNRKGEELLEYKESEILGKVWFEIGVLPENISIKIKDFFKQLTQMSEISNDSVEHELITKSGKKIMLSFRNSLLFDQEKKVVGVLSSGSDVTERAKAEKELQKQHDFLQTIINSVGSGIMVIHKDYGVHLMNNTAREMIDERIIENHSHPKCYEISHHQSMPCDGSKHPCPLENAIRTKSITRVIHKHSTLSGEDKVVELTAVPLIDESGEVYGIVESAHNITELKRTQNELKHQAQHDSLTGLANRVLFLDRLNQSIKNAKRYSENIAVLFIDLDHFKEVNDSMGHSVGDLLLETVSKKLTNTIRKSDTVARLGGDEFAIVLNHFDHLEVVTSVVQNIKQSLKEPLVINNQQFYVSLSIGISIYPDNGTDADTLIKNADAAMYKAKHSGRNNYQFYTADMTERAFERVVLETQLRQSIEKGEMQVYYQPQVDARSEKIIGMEALIRWNHPDMGLVSPAKFIQLAEDCGFIINLDEWVMNESARQFKKWYDKGLNPGVLSLNLSILRLEKDDFVEQVKNSIAENQISAQWLSFEVIESSIMKNPDKSIEKLSELNKLGIGLAIDDFGTGYSSLSYLKKLPINKLKIDRSFVMDIPDDLDDVEITKTIISMAKNLNLEIIAEGVETKEQLDFLVENGCSDIQGYYYYKPLPADEIEEILKRKK